MIRKWLVLYIGGIWICLMLLMIQAIITMPKETQATTADSNYYNYAYVIISNNEIIKGKCQKVTFFQSDRILVEIKGISYLSSSENIILIHKPEE